MQLSKQIYVTDLGDEWKGMYNPFGHHFAFVSKEDWALLDSGQFENLEADLRSYLKDSNFLVEPGFERKWLLEHCELPTQDFYIMFLILTMNCNLACKYCVIKGNEHPMQGFEDTMSLEVGEAALKLFEQYVLTNQPPNARVTYYGGEPTLNPEIMFNLIPKVSKIRYEKMQAPVEQIVITNAYIYKENLTKLFKEYKVNVVVSLDGMKHHHDAVRVTRGGEVTYEQVLENLKRYQDAGLNVNLSTTIGKHNLQDLPEIARFFVKDLGVKCMEFQIPYDTPGNGNHYWATGEEMWAPLMEAYGALKELDAIEGTTYRRIRDLAEGKLRFRDCPAYGGQLVVAPDGMLGPCHSLVGSRTYFGGNVLDESCQVKDLPGFTEWANRTPLNMPECQTCPFITLCGGGCAYNSYVAHNSIWQKDPHVCSYLEYFMDWLLKDLWSKVKEAE